MLWDVIDGERWLENPQLIIANPTRKRKPMAKRVRRRRGRKSAAPRRRRTRRNYTAAGMTNPPRRRRRSRRRRSYGLNPRRRRRYYSRNRRRTVRRYRRNPAGAVSLMGFSLPPLDAVLFTGAGFLIPPIVTSYAMQYLPATWRTSKAAYYGVKAASVLVPSMIVKRFISRRAGNLMLIGGAASFVIDLVREFAPTLLPATAGIGAQPFLGNGVGFYERMPRSAGMGRYASMPVRTMPVQRTPLLSATPERLSPSSRF